MPTKRIEKREVKQSKMLARDFAVDCRMIDNEKRTVEISFSSEEPVMRWGESEILDHSPESVRLERARTNGPLLVDHDWSDHIGTIDDIRIDADRVGRAVVRFGNSARASEIFDDVVANIRKSISVGYRIYEVIKEEDENGNITCRVTDWEVLEVSFVSVPADIVVGVGRSNDNKENDYELITFENEVRKMPKEKNAANNEGQENKAPVITDEQRQAAVAGVENEARKREQVRVDTIRKTAGIYKGNDEIADRAIADGTSVEDFVEKLSEAELKRAETATPKTDLDLTPQETQKFSVSRALMAVATQNWKGAEFERECSDEISTRLDAEPQGVFIPNDIQNRNDRQRVALTTGPTGGALVGTDHLAGSFIDNLRDESLLMRLGARYLTGLRGNVDIPRKLTNAAFGWINEDEDSADSDVTFGTLELSPKTVSGSVGISRRSLLQHNPDIDSLILADMARGMALAVDIAGFAGAAGGKNPIGILNTTGVLTQAVATPGQPTWEEIVGFETAVSAANALSEGSCFVTTAGVRGNLKTTRKDAGSGMFLYENGGTNGYMVDVKTDAGFPANQILFGDFMQFICGMWGVLDLMPDTATKVKSGGLVIRAFQDMDFAVRHPTSFCKSV